MADSLTLLKLDEINRGVATQMYGRMCLPEKVKNNEVKENKNSNDEKAN